MSERLKSWGHGSVVYRFKVLHLCTITAKLCAYDIDQSEYKIAGLQLYTIHRRKAGYHWKQIYFFLGRDLGMEQMESKENGTMTSKKALQGVKGSLVPDVLGGSVLAWTFGMHK